ncbi:ATP-dependent RNA helicase A [Microthyrium microscopicum]|uniref:RNA helicase n=1 Tax=Microthyrium microscopicum TaxID=703497 RepID=A0A6A6UJH2_9PEZI|nr:ATP-dependent RNA helicase A [Microthyrium microscopicum]
MAKKKKKVVANPARGFATTSVASTKTRDDEKDNLVAKPETSADAAKDENVAASQQDKEIHELSSEELEQRLELEELQTFIDSFSSKVIRDSQRQISKIQTDCRVVRPQSHLVSTFSWLPDELLQQVLDYAKKERDSIIAAPLPKDVSEEDWVIRFWSLSRALLGIGVTKDRVYKLLRSLQLKDGEVENGAYIWGLHDCLDRLALDAEPSELPAFDISRPQIAPDPFDDSESSRPQTGNVTPLKSSSRTSVSVPISPKIVQVLDIQDEFEVSDLDSDAEPEDLISTYLSTKSRLFTIHPDLAANAFEKKSRKALTPSITSNSPSVRKMQDKLKRIEGDALFDDQIAKQRWNIERLRMTRENVNPIKRSSRSESVVSSGDESASPSKSRSPSKRSPTRRSPSKSAGRTPEETDESEGELPMDMFTEPGAQGDDETAVNAAGNEAITLREFGKITGVSPRRLLEDACRARDSIVKITFRQVSPTTYSCRHSVSVAWSKSQEKVLDETPPGIAFAQEPSLKDKSRVIKSTFVMTTLAATDVQQSEAFVATVALFCIFSNSPREKVSLKLAGPWRDLWDEFLVFRKSLRDASDRDEVKDIRNIVREHIKAEEENGLVFTAALRNRDQGNLRGGGEDTKNGPDGFQYPAWFYAQQVWQQRIMGPLYQNMLQFRVTLPMFAFRDTALATIHASQVTILCGETGCGKSTQLPAYILESYLLANQECKILCTEPRRISAISLAGRVSQELGEEPNEVGTSQSLVGYAVRLETSIGVLTRLIYATTGVVLRMLESSKGLDEYTHLIVDEVHERSIQTDFLLILLRTLLARRPDFKVILMSATVDSQRFSNYFDGAPIIEVPGRTFPVNTFFLEDAIETTNYAGGKKQAVETEEQEDGDVDQEGSGISGELQGYSVETRNALASYDEYRIDFQLIVKLMEAIVTKPEFARFSKAILVFLPGIGEIRELNDMLASHPAFNCRIYPLHSSVSSEEQQAAFVIPPEGQMKIVLSTNIAETGVTIPDVTCVIDTGKHREMRFDERRQLSRLTQAFISRANAKQRRGRAGRVQEGICYHLFTKHRHDNLMAPQQTPEMLRLSLQDLVMSVKTSGLGDIEDTLGQALDPPTTKNIRRAIDSLIEVGALTQAEELTPLGRQLAKLSLDAHLGKLCILSATFGCLDAGLTIAAILSSKSPFLTPFGSRQQADISRLAFARGDSDLLTVYNAYSAWRRVSEHPNENIFAFCRKNYLSPQVLSNIEDLKAQLYQSLADTGMVPLNRSDMPKHRHHGAIKRGAAGFVHVPRDLDRNSPNDIITSAVISWAFYPKLLLRDGRGFRSVMNNQPISLHPTSVNKNNGKLKYLSYYSIMQSGSKYSNATNAQSTTIAHEVPLVLLAGEAEFKLHAGVITIDSNRLRFAVKDWKTVVALKMLRGKLEELMNWSIEHPGAKVSEELVWWRGAFERLCTKEKDVR